MFERNRKRRDAWETQGQGRKMISDGWDLINKGEDKVSKGIGADPGPMNVFTHLINPFALSEFGSEEVGKGIIHFIGGGVVLVGSIKASEIVPCCSVGELLAAGLFFSGFIHSLVGFRGSPEESDTE